MGSPGNFPFVFEQFGNWRFLKIFRISNRISNHKQVDCDIIKKLRRALIKTYIIEIKLKKNKPYKLNSLPKLRRPP